MSIKKIGVEKTGEEYEESKIDFQEYFDDFIGVTKFGNDLQAIKIWASAEEASYIKTKPLHSSQKKIEEDDNGYTFSIEVLINYELEKLLLSFGEKIKILEPVVLKERIKERLKKNIQNY